MTGPADQPIGIFDSGIGGLTVVRQIWAELPSESTLYFGDTARLPYGNKSAETVRRYATEASRFLLDRGVKLVVAACNTATAHALDALRRELPVPVVGVVEPGARAAVAATRSGRIGVLGTTGTIDSGAYDRVLRRLLPDARIYAQPCPLFVPLVEEGFIDHEATRLIAEEYVRPIRDVGVDALILGCTHYPLLRPMLAGLFGDGTVIVDSAEQTAQEVRRILEGRRLLRAASRSPRHVFAVSDSALRFREHGRRLVGDAFAGVEEVVIDSYEPAA